MTIKKLYTAFLLLLGGAVVFIFGNLYYNVFPTNRSRPYLLGLSIVLLAAALVFKRIPSLSHWFPPVYALFIAAAATLFLLIGPYDLPRDPRDSVRYLAIDKLSQFLHVVPVILVLTLAAGDDLKSIFIAQGNLKRGLTFGVVSFVLWAAAAFGLQAGAIADYGSLARNLPWILLFVFANASMEELWFRGIFLKKYQVLIGRLGAIAVTSLVFGMSHINATYEFPGGSWVFGLVVTGLGAVGAHAMFKEDGLVGPVLFHAGYDLMIIIPVLVTV